MCGICGIYQYGKDKAISDKILIRMNQSLSHRGPDESGMHVEKFIGLGHSRLSIIDLSNGHQPMANEDETIWVTYNGEIYNFKEIRQALILKGHIFKTNCDTEVIVHCYEEYGPECVLKFNGMFAFALWDKKREELLLVRDRLGIKPLYYFQKKGLLLFASEIKALLEHPDVKKEAELDSVLECLFCTAPLNGKTMFKNINALPAGHMLMMKGSQTRIRQYWDVVLSDEGGTGSLHNYKDEAYQLLTDSVEKRLISDVPFGSLLSGGLDSSLVSALGTHFVRHPLKTFSMEYSQNSKSGQHNSDTYYANLMAQRFKTNHKDYIFKPENYWEIQEKVTWHIEKPVELTTPSLFLLYKQLKSDITVVLSGEGADELFGGYFFFLKEAQNSVINEFPWVPYFDEVSSLIAPGISRQTRFKEKIAAGLNDLWHRFDTKDHLNKVLYLFIKVYLLEMLERQDKTSMAWGIEARVPFLDHRLVEYVANIPSQFKMREGVEKYILKEMSRSILPVEVIERKKKPFPIPVDPKSLLKQKTMANELVQSGNSKIAQYFDKKLTNDFFNRKNRFETIDSLAIFRTSYSIIALERWHQLFNV